MMTFSETDLLIIWYCHRYCTLTLTIVNNAFILLQKFYMYRDAGFGFQNLDLGKVTDLPRQVCNFNPNDRLDLQSCTLLKLCTIQKNLFMCPNQHSLSVHTGYTCINCFLIYLCTIPTSHRIFMNRQGPLIDPSLMPVLIFIFILNVTFHCIITIQCAVLCTCVWYLWLEHSGCRHSSALYVYHWYTNVSYL